LEDFVDEYNIFLKYDESRGIHCKIVSTIPELTSYSKMLLMGSLAHSANPLRRKKPLFSFTTLAVKSKLMQSRGG